MKLPSNKIFLLGGIGVLSLSAITFAASSGSADQVDKLAETSARLAVETRFAETQVDEVNCNGFGPLCEVVAGKTVFYVDQKARHAFIGRVFDLDQKADLTEATLNRLGPQPEIIQPDINTPTEYTAAWDQLPFEAAIVRNQGGTRKVAVFSDLNCGYCRNLSMALETANDIEVHEFLVGQIGSEDASRAIGCADDPGLAIAAYFQSRTVPEANCQKDIVGPARRAARAINMQGTPTFVRQDGAVTSGFRDVETLRAWIDASNSAFRTTEISQ